MVGQSKIMDMPHVKMGRGTYKILGMQEHHLLVIGKTEMYIKLGEWVFVFRFNIMDDSCCVMHNVIQGMDFGKIA